MNLREIWKENTILDAGGNRSAQRKPAQASMDQDPNSHRTLAQLGIEPGLHWWKAREQLLRQPARTPPILKTPIFCFINVIFRFFLLRKFGIFQFSQETLFFHSPVTNKHDKHRPTLQVYIIEAYLTEVEVSFWYVNLVVFNK